MAFVIELNQAGFEMKVNAMEHAGKEITTKVNKPDLTGEMPTLEKYIETYGKLLEVMKKYQELIIEDSNRLKSAQSALTYAESQIIK